MTIAEWTDPWPASLYEQDDGAIKYVSDGWDSKAYASREEAIIGQQQWLAYADSADPEEQSWAQMAQQIIDALREEK